MSTRSDLWQPFFEQAGVVILDGGLATELERRGADLSGPLWSAKALIDNPELIRQVHEDYFRAGADVGISASYQASCQGFAQVDLDDKAMAFALFVSVQLVKEARDIFWDVAAHRLGRCRPLVAASIGCYGAALHDGSEYRGDYGLSVRELIDWHRPRLEILAKAGADVLACETIPCLTEAEALVRLLEEFPGLPAWFSFACRDGRSLCAGDSFAEAVRLVQQSPNVVAAGVNCTSPQFIEELLISARAVATIPLLVYPNSGERWDAEAEQWRDAPTQLDWSEAACRWRSIGAQLIGGCCRTTPETIHQIATALR
ncbi:MAG: homocysteine S-methyltransferase [Gemmataceae bacterium]|nr:homocysteine S-methyltransferase [Gemmataceae bacterium]